MIPDDILRMVKNSSKKKLRSLGIYFQLLDLYEAKSPEPAGLEIRGIGRMLIALEFYWFYEISDFLFQAQKCIMKQTDADVCTFKADQLAFRTFMRIKIKKINHE